MVDRLISVGDDLTLPPSVKATDANLPSRLGEAALSATIASGIGTGGVLDQMYAAANPAPAVDVPAVTVAAGSIAPITGVALPWDTKNLRTIGSNPGVGVWNGNNYMDNRANGTQSGGGGMPWAFEFVVNDAEFAFRFAALSGSPRLWIWVDGRPVGRGPQTLSTTAGASYWARVAFGSARPRVVRVWFGFMAFGGFVSATPVSAPPVTEPIRAAFVGDSWFTGGAPNEGGWPYTMSHIAGRLLGWNTMQASIGGTGYANGALPYTHEGRKSAVAAFAPHYVVVWGSINDKVQPPATVQAKASELYDYYATSLPNTKVIVVGPQPAPAATAYTTDTFLEATRQAVKAAANAAPNVIGFIDPIEQRWVVGTGHIGNPKGDGNADYYIAPDTVHPSPMGGSYFARRMVEEIVRVLAANNLPWHEWTGTPIADPNEPVNALSDIITDNLLAEITVRNVSATDGATVGTVTPARGSKTTTLVQSTEASKPVYVASDSGHPALKFTGAQTLPQPVWSAPLAAGAPVTLFVVARIATFGTGSVNFTEGTSTTNRLRVSMQHTGVMNVSGSGTGIVAGTPGTTGTYWRIFAVALESQSMNVWDTSLTKYGPTAIDFANTVLSGIGVNGWGGGSTGWETRVRDVIAYSGRMSDDNIKRMIQHLSSRYGIALV